MNAQRQWLNKYTESSEQYLAATTIHWLLLLARAEFLFYFLPRFFFFFNCDLRHSFDLWLDCYSVLHASGSPFFFSFFSLTFADWCGIGRLRRAALLSPFFAFGFFFFFFSFISWERLHHGRVEREHTAPPPPKVYVLLPIETRVLAAWCVVFSFFSLDVCSIFLSQFSQIRKRSLLSLALLLLDTPKYPPSPVNPMPREIPCLHQ